MGTVFAPNGFLSREMFLEEAHWASSIAWECGERTDGEGGEWGSMLPWLLLANLAAAGLGWQVAAVVGGAGAGGPRSLAFLFLVSRLAVDSVCVREGR
jgi:hypothetical protein